MLLGANALRADLAPRWALLGAYTLRTDQVPPQAPRHTVRSAAGQLGSGVFIEVTRVLVRVFEVTLGRY